MDVSSIANLATSMSQVKTSQDVAITVFKKALDVESETALALIDAIPASSGANLPPHLGQNINTTA